MEKDKLDEALAGLSDVDAEAFAKALHSSHPELYQTIFNAGHSKATADSKGKLTSADSEKAELQKKVQQLETRIETLQQDSPDVAKIEAKYEAKLEELATKLEESENRHTTEIGEWKDRLRGKSQQTTFDGLASTLVREYGLDPVYAKVLTRDEDVRKRVKFDEEGNLASVYQADGITPVPVPDGSNPVKVLARDVAKSVPDRFKEDRRQGGSGVNGGDGGGGARRWKESEIAAMSDAEYEKNANEIQAAVKEGRVVKDVAPV